MALPAPIANPFQPTTVPAAAPIQPVVSGLTPPHDHGQDIAMPAPLDLPEPILQHHDPDAEPALNPFSASIPAAHTQAMIDAADKEAREVANKILEALKYGIDQGNDIVLKFGGHFIRISKALAMQLYRHPEVIVGAVAGVLFHMHRTNAAENAQVQALAKTSTISVNSDRAMRHVYPPVIDYNSELSTNMGFNPVPVGINGMNPSPTFTPITAPHISGYHFPEGDEPLPTTPASHQPHAQEGDTPQPTPADGGGSLLYDVISATLVAVAAATGLGIVVHLVNTPELQMIFQAVKKQTAKGKDSEPNWVKGLPAFSFPHGQHGQTPGAPCLIVGRSSNTYTTGCLGTRGGMPVQLRIQLTLLV